MLVRPRSLVAVLGAAALAGALLTQPGSAADPVVQPIRDAGDPAAARAVQLLDEADAAFSGSGSGRDTTMVLLDLARAQADLPAARRAEASEILARPTDDSGPEGDLGLRYKPGANPTVSCEGGFCVHWATATGDAPSLTDADANGRPDAVDQVLATLIQVGSTYVQAGYRKPVSDGTKDGGVDQFDVFLVDSGAQGIYGYCAPEGVTSGSRSAQAYCAVDNDFAEFPTNTPVENMQVTVAHEYFHAVQFAYDLTDDGWLLESTAAWVEDEVFPDVNDNVQYLRSSPISQPQIPIDKGQDLRVYGSWIFFRYLSEIEPTEQGGLPTIIRDIWEKAAGPSYSIKAIEAVLKQRGRSLTKTVAGFSDANRHPGSSYVEGDLYPTAKPIDSAKVSAGSVKRGTMTLDHLASGSYRFKPGAGTRSKGWKLQVVVDLAGKKIPTAAVVTTRAKSGGFTTKLVKLKKSGAGSIRVPFSSAEVSYVDVTLVNASTRYQCDRGTPYSCQGKPKDDNLALKVAVRARR